MDPSLKTLQIKVKSLERTRKEYAEYLKEETVQRDKIEKMKADNKDEYDIKKQIEVLNDTLTVIPDCRQRTQGFARALCEYLEASHPNAPAADPANEVDTLVLDGRKLLEECRKMGIPVEDGEVAPTAGTGDADDDV